MPQVLIIGIGNPDRGDDAAGRLVAQRLSAMAVPHVTIRETDGEATRILELLDGAAKVFLVDASVSGAPPGTIKMFDVVRAPLPEAAFGLSTHGFGLAEAVELARTLGTLPPECIVYAIEGKAFETGAAPSAEVATAVDALVARIAGELAD